MTDEQKKRATKAVLRALSITRESEEAEALSVVEAVAPLVQEPWELPTENEITRFDQLLFTRSGLRDFITCRNSARLPKVDPVARKGDIQRQLRVRVEPNQMVPNIHLTHEDAQAILAALDKMKEAK